MKKVLLALALLVLLSILASAENDSATTGPYKVSFDLGVPHSAYNITVSEPKSTESLSGDKSTIYGIKIRNNTGILNFMDIGITYHDIARLVLTSDELKYVISQTLIDDPSTSNVDTATRTIDNSSGAIGSCDVTESGFKIKSYLAGYNLKTDPTRTTVTITSFEPWDEGTLQLLKTIHVEKIAGKK